MKKQMMAVLFAAAVLGLSACGGKEQETTETVPETIRIEESATETATETETETEDPYAVPEGMMHSYLTGEIVSEEVGTRRPYAIMINNIKASLPQSGIGAADMIYEAQVEGGITRLLAVYEDVDDLEKIGSVRSARHYYIDFSNDNDAIYVHYGQSKYALERINSENITTIHGLSGYESSVFYRSSDREAPHNVYTTGEMLAKGLEITGLSRDYPDGFTPRLLFNVVDTVPAEGTDAAKVNIPFDSRPYFTYNTDDGLYYRYQYGEAQIDREENTQLAFKNIIVQYVKEASISSQDHQDLTLNGSGSGLYITDGKAMEITWQRADDSDKTRYYDADGNQISLNPGKTFFEIISDSKTVTFE
ncbi:MAG: DUF3048 domain-containing protein [Coprococcus sp.]